MASREEFVRKIDEAYAHRVAGHKEALGAMMAPDATFRIAGESLPLPGVPTQGLAAMKLAGLIDNFQFHKVERLDAIVEGDKAAVRSRVVLSSEDRPETTAELYDLWTMGPDGKFTSLTQFCDAALIAWLISR